MVQGSGTTGSTTPSTVPTAPPGQPQSIQPSAGVPAAVMGAVAVADPQRGAAVRGSVDVAQPGSALAVTLLAARARLAGPHRAGTVIAGRLRRSGVGPGRVRFSVALNAAARGGLRPVGTSSWPCACR